MRCLALFTGGLDSQIAVKLMQRQGIEVVGVHVATPFTRSPSPVQVAARQLQMELHTIGWKSDYLPLVRQPLFGFAQEMAPCLDCRIGMVSRAKALLEPLQASFLISGEVIGQRPSSLRSRDLETIAVRGGMDDLLLRPLSAKFLPETLPERKGWVDRSQLFDWHGKGRREQLQLARDWGLSEPAGHSAGCLLLDATYATRLKRLLVVEQNPEPGELATLHLGRHFWHEREGHLVVSRNAKEGAQLRTIYASSQRGEFALLESINFRGPIALQCGHLEVSLFNAAAIVIEQFSKDIVPKKSFLQVRCPGRPPLWIPLPRQPDAEHTEDRFLP